MKRIIGLALLLFTTAANVYGDGKNQITEYELESAIVGDKEQPAVSYFIPWKGTSTPDKLQWSLDSKYDETLGLVDREVMVRSLNIYEVMNLESQDTTPAE